MNNQDKKNQGQHHGKAIEDVASEKDGAPAAQSAVQGLKELGLQPSQQLKEDAAGGRPPWVPGKQGRSLAHLERIIQSGCWDILKLVVLALARDVMNGRSETYNDQFEVVAAMLTELQQHDNRAHLKAAREALA